MIDLVEASADAAPAPTRRRHRRRWILAGLGLILVVAGSITWITLDRHYSDAPALVSNGGAGWLAPDQAHSRNVQLGSLQGSVIAPRYAQWQTFSVDVTNNSSVSQTVLGLVDAKTLADPNFTGEPERLTISTRATNGDYQGPFTSKPVTIRPGKTYSLRFSHLTASAKHWPCNTEYWTDMLLRVRVGMHTRSEDVSFGPFVYQITGPNEPNC